MTSAELVVDNNDPFLLVDDTLTVSAGSDFNTVPADGALENDVILLDPTNASIETTSPS